MKEDVAVLFSAIDYLNANSYRSFQKDRLHEYHSQTYILRRRHHVYCSILRSRLLFLGKTHRSRRITILT
jgi:hypothetical protein